MLVRHGRTAANAAAVLAGRSPGVVLDDAGRDQARRLGDRLAAVPLARVVSSPLERTVETGRIVLRGRSDGLRLRRDRGLLECGYGAWTGRPLRELAKDPLWKVVQTHPSAVTFPGGEAMPDMQHRAVTAVRRHDREVADEHGPDAVWVAISHADVIKAVLADALGLHLDQFQRIVVDPASVSVVRYTAQRPFVLHVNDHGSDLSSLRPAPRRGRRKRGARAADSEAVPGGGAGPATGRSA